MTTVPHPPVASPASGRRPQPLSYGALAESATHHSPGGAVPSSARGALGGPSANTVDPKLWAATCRSIKDRIYQRSENLRKTYRELDASGTGAITLEDFVTEMRRSFMLNALEQACLRTMLIEADFHKDGVLDFREFCEMLKTHDRQVDPVITENERRRFQSKGLMDAHVLRMMLELDAAQPIRVHSGLPTNELGQLTIECPFGVLGDSERMDAVIATFLDRKLESLRTALIAQDADHDGQLTHAEFRVAMKRVDRYIFDDELAALIAVLDRKKRGFIGINEFVNGLGHEYLKKKAHRSNAAFDNPFKWDHAAAAGTEPPPSAGGVKGSSQRGGAEGASTPRRKGAKGHATRASEMRVLATRHQLNQMLSGSAGSFTAGAPRSTAVGSMMPQLKGAAVAERSPRGLAREATTAPHTARLPQIASASS